MARPHPVWFARGVRPGPRSGSLGDCRDMHGLTRPATLNTTFDLDRTRFAPGRDVPEGASARSGPLELCQHYRDVLAEPRVSWTESHRVLRRLGSGGQGVVFLCERGGSDGFTLPVAVK